MAREKLGHEQFCVRINPSVLSDARKLAKKQDIRLGELVEIALVDLLEYYRRKNEKAKGK